MHDPKKLGETIVRSPEPGRQRAALLLAYRYLSGSLALEAAAQACAAAEQGKFDLSGLAEAVRGQRLVGAGLVQLAAGRIAALHPPQLLANEPEQTAQQLFAWCEQFARSQNATLLQAALQPHAADADRFVAAGFTKAADLIFLGWAAEQATGSPELPFTLERYDGDRERLTRVIEATYADSLDIPLLDGLRATDDVIDGYLATGLFRPEWWFYVVDREGDVGCLLVNDFPDQDRGELVYMGLKPVARGRGWGSLLTQQAQHLVAAAPRLHLLLAVDEANHPARIAYEENGFQPWETRAVYLKSL